MLRKKPSAKTYALAAVQNEQVTRQRVDELDKTIKRLSLCVSGTAAITTRPTLRGRLRWLLTGR